MVGRIPESVGDLLNFREFSQSLPTNVLTRLKFVIAILKYFLDVIMNPDGVFSQSCYSHLNTPINQ